MATIQYIANLIDRASRPMRDIALAAGRLETAMDNAADTMDRLDRTSYALGLSVNNLGDRVSRLGAKLTINTKAVKENTEALNNMTKAAVGAAAAQGVFGGALSKSAASGTRLWGVWRALGGSVALFAGAKVVGAFHLALDAVIETLAILVPATAVAAAGLIAFGVAGSDAAKAIYTQMVNAHNIFDATGKTVPPLTGNIEKLHNAVKPQVFQLFGDALDIVAKKSGLFNKLAIETGAILDRMAAHVTVALVNSGSGLNKFISVGQRDLAQLGKVLMNIGDALFRLIKVTEQTHIAEFLLVALVAASKLLDLITKLPTPILAIVVGLHGLYLWGGLAVTGIARLVGALARMSLAAGGVKAASSAVAGLGKNATPLQRLGAAFRDVGTGVGALPGRITKLGSKLAGLFSSPWTWAVIGALAIGGLIIAMVTARSATQRWLDALQQGLMKTDAIKGLAMLTADLGTVAAKAASAQAHLGVVQQRVNQQQQNGGMITRALTLELLAARQKAGELSSGTARLVDESKLYSYRLGILARQHGGNTNAMTLMQLAGIRMKDMLDNTGASGKKQALAFKIIQQQIDGVVKGYEAMGIKGGMLGNTMDMLGNSSGTITQQMSDQYKAIHQLIQQWSTFTQSVTATQMSFDTFSLGLITIHKNFQSAQAAVQRTTHTLGGLRVASSLSGATLDGLSQASLTVNQAFSSNINNAQALIGTWLAAGVATNRFKRGVKDLIAPMVGFARGSKEGTAQLIALAEQAGYRGPNSMRRLVDWLGNTHKALRTVKDITNQATIQEALLTGAMRNQGNYIASNLLRELSNAELHYSNVTQDVRDWGKAIAEQGRQSDAARSARNRLIDDLITTGRRAGDSSKQIAAMITKITGIPAHKALELVLTGSGSFSITQRALGKAGNLAGSGPTGTKHGQAGFRVPGYGGGDTFPALLEGGEAVVPKHLTPSVAPFLKAHGVPGFAAGGLIQRGDRAVLSGQEYVTDENKLQDRMVGVMERALVAAIKAGQTVLGGGTGSEVAKYALKFAGAPYVLGGATPRGWDCSGFTAWVYEHFGLMPAAQGTRFGTSESQFAWAKKTPNPEIGGLAFFNDGIFANPGHVGIITSPTMYISAHSPAKGTSNSPISGAVGFGIPPGRSVASFERRPQGGGGALPGGGSVAANIALGRQEASGFGWGTGPSWHDLFLLWNRESGWRNNAQNPTSSAYGIAQFLDSTWATVGGHKTSSPGQQIFLGLRYIQRRYNNPETAWAHELAFNSYERGTKGAAPGWAWVGERGPELVNLHGGETIIDAVNSRLSGFQPARGYVSGSGGTGGSGGPAESLMRKLFDYWIKHFEKFREAHKSIYGHLHGQALFHYWETHWQKWIKDNLHRVRGHGGGGGGGGHGGGPHLPRGMTAEQKAGQALQGYFNHPGTIAQNNAELRVFLRDIRKYFHGASAKRREDLVRKQVEHLDAVRAKLTAINEKIAAAHQYQQSTQQNLAGAFNLSNMTLGGSMVGSKTLSGAQSLNQQLRSRLGQLKKFGRVIKKLAAAHVDSDLIRQVVDLGPDAGTQFGEEILAGGPALIKTLNATERAIRKATGEVSRGATSAVYEGRYDTGKNFLKELNKQQAGLQKLMAKLGRTLGEEAARWFRTAGVREHHGPVPGHRHRGPGRGVREHPGPPGRPAPGVHNHPGSAAIDWEGWDYSASGAQIAARTTPAGRGHIGPLISFGGDMVIREEADVALLSQKLGFAINAAGLGS